MANNISIAPVSVIIPVFNRTQTLCSAIESLFAQTVKPTEIFVVDDGSSIDLEYTLKPYLSRISYIRVLENKGVSTARNLGVKMANSDYVAFLDSDDIWLNDKLFLQYEFMKTNGYLASHTDEYWYRDGVFVNKSKNHQKYGGEIFDKILDICRVSMSCFMINRNLFLELGGFDESLRVCEDYDFAIRLSIDDKIGFLERNCIIKRAITDNSLSESIQHIEHKRLEILQNIKKKSFNLKDEQSRYLDEEIARKCLIVRK